MLNKFRFAKFMHWPEYLMEAFGLGLFMIVACTVVTLFEHPSAPFHAAITDPLLRRFITGCLMGLTAMALVYSPWGKRSGAHLNPAVTLTFFRLGKVKGIDAAAYITAQFLGAWAGVWLAAIILGPLLADPTVNYIVTAPGVGGVMAAFLAELFISFGLMTAVLTFSGTPGAAPLTGVVAGVLVAAYITVEAPISGTSMNPARSLGSALFARCWSGIWIYFTAPLLGMLAAAEVLRRRPDLRQAMCAKLYHSLAVRCIFCGHRP